MTGTRIKYLFVISYLFASVFVFLPVVVRADGPSARIEPTSGPVGTKITVNGGGFRVSEDGITITYDGEIIKCNFIADYTGNFEGTATIPPSTKGRHSVGVFGSDFTPRGIIKDNYFEVIPDIDLVSQMYFEPVTKKSSIKLTVNGSGFAKNEPINITFDGLDMTTAVADDFGSFGASFEVPQVKETKEYVIAATGSDSSSAQANFLVDKPHPAEPKLLSPANGASLEIFSSPVDVILAPARALGSTPKTLKSVRATFAWTETVESGSASYILQIATNYDFSSPVISKANLSSPSYALSKQDVLSPGTYYWRVKAIDAFSDESEWSKTGKFDVILVSQRVQTITVISVLLLIGALIIGISVWRLNSRD